jgi:anti-sigma-K factor RskA
MSTPEHDTLQELSGPYAVGALDARDRAAFEAHLRTCLECRREVESFAPVVAGLASAVPELVPPPGLRRRVLERVAGHIVDAGSPRDESSQEGIRPSPRARGGWLAAAAGLVLAAALGYTTWDRQQQVNDLEARLRDVSARARALETQVADASRTTAVVRAHLSVLTAPDMARVDLVGEQPARSASGRAYWSRSQGLVFTASNLPAPPPGRTYQLWVVTATAPVSAGLIQPDQAGNVSAVFQTPADLPPPLAMAVTLEPEGGVPAPTGPRYLIGTPGRSA